MRIICPKCEAEYDVPEPLLKPGRPVSCARCKSRWVPLPEDAAAPVDNAGLPPDRAAAAAHPGPDGFGGTVAGVTAMDRLVAGAATLPEQATPALRAAWLATGVVLGGACVSAIVWHTAAMRAWPPIGWVLSPIARVLGI